MKYAVLFLGSENMQGVESYFEDTFEVYWKSEGELSEEEKKEYKYIINFDEEKREGDIISIQSICECRYVPIFKWFFERGFRVTGEKANALFVCYILQKNYCFCMYDFWILYEAVFELEHFSKTVEIWNPEYKLYDDFRERLLDELDSIKVWK